MPPSLQIDGLGKRFGPFWAVRAVDFVLERGEVLGFLGPNGAGKSTTMKMITGFLPPSQGRALVRGADVVDQPMAARRAIGYLPEGAPLYGDMTTAGLLDFIARLRRLSRAQRRERREWVAERLGLAEVWYRPIDTLSKGFKRRVGLAQAILHDPEILILDEPTDGLDPNQKHEVRSLLREMAADKAIVVSTHLLEEVTAVCTRAMIIAEGRIIADAAPDTLFAGEPPEAVFRRLTLDPRLGEAAGPATR
ncbi:MAG: ABC transporter ATP-binding protein [Rhodospirillales bacterium]